MSSVKWAITASVLYVASMILFSICNLVTLTDATWLVLYTSGMVLGFAGGFTLIGAWLNR